jgi:CubicO group peptidase (beta-lactamase class C family)
MKRIPLFLLSTVLLLISCKEEKTKTEPEEVSLIENGLLAAVQIEGEALTTYTLEERMEFFNVPGISIAVVKDGQLHWAKGYGIANTETGTRVDANTMFQAGSISKPLAALAALKLVEMGKVDLNTDVNDYLIGWKVPDSEFSAKEKVTLRRLLTHTAGTTVHGFPGYMEKDSFPSINDVLNGKGNTDEIIVDTTPGSNWRYSGGGYTIMEKVVEDISGMPLDQFAIKEIFEPVGMENSTYEQPLSSKYHSQASAAYDGDGTIIEGYWHNYPEQAAAGLWTTPSDLAKYCMEIQNIRAGKEDGVLSRKLVDSMLTKHQNDWGLGPMLQKEGDSLLFGHGGKNAGFTNNFFAFAQQGNAAIVMTNADQGGDLIGELFRAISKEYKWGVSEYTVVKAIELPADQINSFAGAYQIGDYRVDMEIREGKLTAVHPGSPKGTELIPVDQLKFVDGLNGSELQFHIATDSTKAGFTIDGNHFYKVD